MKAITIFGGLALLAGSAWGGPMGFVFGNAPSGTQQLLLNGGAVTLNASATGWWSQTGFHDSANPNYVAGNCPPCAGGPLFNDYFVFGFASTLPTVTSAQLSIGNPASGSSTQGYVSANATETLQIWDVSTVISTLIASGAGQVGIYNDLGSGTMFASQTVSGADNGTQIVITLNAAGIAAINAAIQNGGGGFAFGGALAPPSGVPEPSTAAFLGVGAAALAALARRRNRNQA